MKDLLKILEDDKKLIDNEIEKLYSGNEFEEMCNYAVFSGGKRIRPILFLESFKAFSKLENHAIKFAIALELIHNYSLVHDDLPEMDDDKYRRGKLSVYGKYGQSNAVLVGDELLNNANLIMFNEILNMSTLEEKNRGLKVASLILNSSGKNGMIYGQYLDLKENSKNLEEIKLINDKKTGALFKGAIIGGAMLSGASQEDINSLAEYANDLGLLFQLQDDLFDYEEDLKLNKNTVVTILGIEETKKQIEKLKERALKELSKVYGNTKFLNNFLNYILKREF